MDLLSGAPRQERAKARKSWLYLGLILASGLALSACDTVKESLIEADQSLQSAFGEDGEPAVQSKPRASAADPQAETHYRQAMSDKTAGRHDEALAGFEQAGDLGHREAAFEAATAYMDGRGTEKDLDRASEWMNLAADRGEPRALYLSGLNHATGNGVEKNDSLAAAYFGDAAVQGHTAAQYQLAEAFAEGRGVNKDLAWAMRWYGKAANQGHAKAQLAFGILLAAGSVYQADVPAGYRWLLLAADQGNQDAAKAVQALSGKLEPSQRAKAEAWARTYKPGQPSDFADSPTVMYVQHRLNGMGYKAGPVDGVTGPRTQSAVVSYKSAKGLAENGSITLDLVEALFQDANGTS